MKGIENALREHFRSHHGVIGRSDVLALGGSGHLIRSRLHAGAWTRQHENVYLLAAADRTPMQDHVAALTAVPGAVLSHGSAAWLLGLLDRAPDHPELTTGGQRRELRGVVVHRSKASPPLVRVQGLACTTATRTLVDLAATTSPTTLTAALDRALLHKHTAVPRLEDALRTTERGRPGCRALAAQLKARGLTGTPEPSVLESKMDRLLHRSGLPSPCPQLQIDGGRYRLDYAWPALRLAVEVKGYAWHSSPESAQADAERERRLVGDRWTLLSFTWTEVTRRPGQVSAEIYDAYERLSSSSFSARRKSRRGKDAACG